MTSLARVEDRVSIVCIVYASVGAEKLGGGSCPNRGHTTVSSSILSYCLAMVSTHAPELRYQLWIFRL